MRGKNKLVVGDLCRLYTKDPELREKISQDLTFPNPEYVSAVKYYVTQLEDIPKHINFYTETDEYIGFPQGYLWGLDADNLDIEDVTCFPPDKKLNHRIKLYPYQERLANALLNTRYGIGVAPPGSGKTVVGLYIIAQLDSTALWVTPTRVLLDQTINRAKEFLEITDQDIGIIGDGKNHISRVTLAIPDTLVNLDLSALRDRFGVVLFDECHRVPANRNKIINCGLAPFHTYGITATPYRGDNLDKAIAICIGPIVETIHKEEIEGRIKVKCKIRETSFRYTLRKDKRGNSIVHSRTYPHMVSRLVENESRNNMIVNDVVREVREGNLCLVLTGQIKHIKILYDMLKHKVFALYTHSKMKKKEQVANEERFTKLTSGVLIATYQKLAEGFDVKAISRLFITFPIKSKRELTQSIGRAEREYKDKTAVLYDYMDVNVVLLQKQIRTRLDIYEEAGVKLI